MRKTNLLQTTAAALLLAAAASASAQTVLKIGYATTKESHYGVGSTVFCDEITKGTSNRYSCQHFPSSALGNFVPEVKIIDIPFLFRDHDHARHTMDGPIGQDILKKCRAKA